MKPLQKISDLMKSVGGACLVGMMLLTCADVVGRLFKHPIFGSVELVTIMATLSIALALPFTQETDGHVGVEILTRLFSPRVQTIISICTSILSCALFVIFAWRIGLYAHDLQRSGEVSMNLKLPEYLVVYAICFSMIILMLVIIRDIINLIRKLRTQ